jgi:hypothetical protein
MDPCVNLAFLSDATVRDMTTELKTFLGTDKYAERLLAYCCGDLPKTFAPAAFAQPPRGHRLCCGDSGGQGL